MHALLCTVTVAYVERLNKGCLARTDPQVHECMPDTGTSKRTGLRLATAYTAATATHLSWNKRKTEIFALA